MIEPSDYLSLPADNRIGPSCGVTAVAVAAQRPFAEVWAYFAARKSSRWKGGTKVTERMDALRHFGVAFEESTPRVRFTLQRFVREAANPDAVYMVRTTGHVQIVHRRMILDQHGAKHPGVFWGRRKLVSHVLRLID